MELNKCMGCMENCESYPCPKCGYDPNKDPRPEYALPPETILAGKFLLGRVLGQDEIGITYIGWDIGLGQKVAIREYFPDLGICTTRELDTGHLVWRSGESAERARGEVRELFLEEAKKTAKADGIPGIARIRGMFRANDTDYIVMDYVEGETLRDRIRKSGPLSWEQAKRVFRPALQTMEAVHKAGLLHRNLNPGNLMLTPDGQVKILGLGLLDYRNINHTFSAPLMYSLGEFGAPERAQNSAGPWTDVYSMAATVYHALTGNIVFLDLDETGYTLLNGSLALPDTLPKSAREALEKALAPAYPSRTQSMEELEKGLFDEAPQSKPEPKPEPKPELKPEPKPEPQPQPKKVSKKIIWAAVAAVAVVLCGVIWVTVVKPTNMNKQGQPPVNAGQFDEATSASETLESYQDTTPNAEEAKLVQQMTPLACGSFHSVGLHSDGTVVAIGWNEDVGQCDVDDWTDIVAVSAGANHTVGLHSDGTVVAVGKNEGSQCDVDGWTDIVAVSAGSDHTVGLRSNGTVVAVGSNAAGQCDVSGWSDIVAVSAGGWHTLGLRSDGTVVVAGSNVFGQCDVSSWQNIVAVCGGGTHTVGLRSDGTVVAVGENDNGQCDVSGWTDIVAVSAGAYHTVGLRSDGTVVAIGWDLGQCDVSDWSNIATVAAGWWHTLGLRSDGTVVTAGINHDDMRYSISKWEDIRMTPVNVNPSGASQDNTQAETAVSSNQAKTVVSDIQQKNSIAAGNTHTVGLHSNGTVVAVGDNEYGQCNIENWADIISLAASDIHTVGLRSNGTVVATGDNGSGQCDVENWKDIVSVAAGNYYLSDRHCGYTLGLQSDGTVVAVGSNDFGQCDVDSWTDIVSVATGDTHAVGLRRDGTVVAAGNNAYGQCDVSGWRNIVAVAAGSSYTVGLRNDGTVVTVGDNSEGQCDVNNWTDITAIAANGQHTIGLHKDGTVVAVGWSYNGQCDVEKWTDIVSIAAGGSHTIGLRSNGTTVGTGYIPAMGEYNPVGGKTDLDTWKDILTP